MGQRNVGWQYCRGGVAGALGVGLLALASCADRGTGRSDEQSLALTRQDPARGGATVAMEVKWLPQNAVAWQVLPPDGTMPSGARFTVRVELPSPTYLYLAQRGEDGSLHWLAPNEGVPETPASSAEVAQLPDGEGRWFSLDNKPGRETLFVIAAAQTQSRLDLARRLNAEPAAAEVIRRDPPPLVTQDKRGLQGMHVVRVGVSPQGVTLLRLDYRHG